MPGAQTSVYIPDVANDPEMNASLTVFDFRLASGGSYTRSLDGTLRCYGDFYIYGTYDITAAYTILNGGSSGNFANVGGSGSFSYIGLLIGFDQNAYYRLANSITDLWMFEHSTNYSSEFDMNNFNLTISGTSSNRFNLPASQTFYQRSGTLSIASSAATITDASFNEGTGTTNFYRTGSQTVPAVTYYNLTISGGGSNTKTAAGTISITNNLTVDASTTLAIGTTTATIGGTTDVNGAVTISTGTLDANGTFDATGGTVTFTSTGNLNLGGSTNTSLGTFTESTSTVTYDRAGAQGVIADTYYNLVFSGGASNTKTAAGAVNVSNNLTVDASTEYALAATTTTVTGTSDINGTISLSTGTYDSNGTFDATGGNVTFTGTGFLLLGGATNTSLGTMTMTIGTVNYDRAGVQNIVEDIYFNLIISGGSTKSIVGTGTKLEGNGLLTVDAGATLAIGDNDLKRNNFGASGGSHIEGTVTLNDGWWTTTYGSGQSLTSTGGTITVTGTGTINQLGLGTPDFGTFTAGSGLVQYNRASSQNVASAPTYYNLDLNGSTKTLMGTTTVTNDLNIPGTTAIGSETINVGGAATVTGTATISTGTLNVDGTFDATGGAVTFSDAGFLYLGSTVTDLGTLTLGTGCTVAYDAAGAQNVDNVDYYNLTIDGSGTKTLQGNINISGSDGEGVLTVDTGCTFAIGDHTITHTVLDDFGTENNTIIGTVTLNNGDWTPTYGEDANLTTSGSITVTGTGIIRLTGGRGHTLGTFTPGNGTVYYARNGSMTIAANSFNNLVVDGNTGTKTLAGAIDVDGDLTLTNNGGGLLDVSGSDYGINLAGTWTNNGTFTAQSGTVTLDGASDQAISGSSSTTFYNLTNSNSATTVTLNQDITVTNTLAMSGTADVDMNANNIDLSSAGTISGETNSDRIYDTAGTTDVSGVITTTRTLNAPAAVNVGGMGAIFTSAANMGSTTIKRGHVEQTGLLGNTSIHRYYSITPTTNTGLDATLVFNYFDGELNGQGANESDFVLWRSTDGGTNWVNNFGIVNTGSNTVTLDEIDAFSLWTPSSESASPLPVKLISFDAIPHQNTVELAWVTASEKNSAYFEIEKSINGDFFEVIGQTTAAGSSIEMLRYSELDRNPTQGISYYRLKLVDLDGSFITSDIRSVVYGTKSSNKLIPNPSNGMFVTLMLKGTNYQKGEWGKILIVNELGQVVHKETVQMNSISFTITPSSRLSPGYYSVVVMQGDKRIASDKMVVQW